MDSAPTEQMLRALSVSMEADCYPGADIVRDAADQIEQLTRLLHAKLSVELDMADVVTTSERLIESERDIYKERAERAEAGWSEVERLLHVNEVAFDEDTNAAVDELNRWRERAVATAEDADRLAEAIKAHGPYMDEHCHTALRQHDEAMTLWFCPEHGGPVDDCEQCRDEQEMADDQTTDDDWVPD